LGADFFGAETRRPAFLPFLFLLVVAFPERFVDARPARFCWARRPELDCFFLDRAAPRALAMGPPSTDR
jgi:hypothetical protein